MKKIIFFVFNFCLFLTIVSCGESEEFDNWEKEGYSPTVIEDISISSSASDNASVAFGQTYQHQVTTTGT